MDKQQILDYVINYINTEFGESTGTVTPDTQLLSTRLLDSINTLHMVNDLEEHFKMEVAAHEVNPDNLNTPGQIAEWIAKKLA